MNETKVPNSSAWQVRQYRNGDQVEIRDVKRVDRPAPQDTVTLRSLPARLSEDPTGDRRTFEELLYNDRSLPAAARQMAHARAQNALFKSGTDWPGSEVREITRTEQLTNRINLTIVGDGYTADQKEKFFADAARIKDDLFATSTFKSYLPLFNVHAVFVPSNQSGLSDGDDKRDTALGLYRDPAGSKRGIMPGNPDAIDRAVSLAPATDYPILLANDDFYGGLGGQYAITTRSPRSGAIVLRHELGHNFGNVGEEYDGGEVYTGANHSDTTDVGWKAWVDGPLAVYDAKPLAGGYPWQNLKSGPITFDFDVTAPSKKRDTSTNPTVRMDGSFVGWETANDVQFLLDGKPVPVKADTTNDRGFFSVQAGDVAPGHHQLTVAEQIHDGDNVLANIRITQVTPGYDFSRDKVEAYPTFNDQNALVGYRPTHESCPMRDMTATEFCAIDKENMWKQFLNRISLIDRVDTGRGDDGKRFVEVHTPALQGLDIRWYSLKEKGGEVEIPALAGKNRWTPDEGDHNQYRVRVHFSTPEVRVYDDHFTAANDVQL